MGRYLNSIVPLETYKRIAGTRFFVDKTFLLEDVLNAVEMDGQKYLCITRPRRFGKSVMANMVGCFLGRASDSSGIFGNLAIAGNECYGKHLNQHNMIFIMSSILTAFRMGLMGIWQRPIRTRGLIHLIVCGIIY